MKYIKIVFTLILIIGFLMAFQSNSIEKQYKMSLSEYGFFEDNIADLKPTERVVRYELNTPLFSDYTEKVRFIYIPEGQKANYHSTQVMDFPLGTTIIKNFYYPVDERKPEKGRQLLETRLLINEEKGWKALPYIWGEDQTDAYLEVAGGDKNISWKDQNGKKKTIDYSIPNMNQCKGCHLREDKIVPIGPSARQLNRMVQTTTGEQHQLDYLVQNDFLEGVPEYENLPEFAVWDAPKSGTLDQRARAYLDANCGHCHNSEGPANTSGLFLNYTEKDPAKWGVLKSPIAAGRGSGDRLYNIVPGKPHESILIYRMESQDPGVMMPELSRKLVHKEGLNLIRDWIEAME